MTLKVAINAQLIPGAGVGGVHSVLLGLVHALAKLDGPEEYVVIVPWEEPDWLNPYLGKNQRAVPGKKLDAFKRALGPAKPLGKLARRALAWKPARSESRPGLARSNGFFEGLGCKCCPLSIPALCVFPTFRRCSIPTICNTPTIHSFLLLASFTGERSPMERAAGRHIRWRSVRSG